MNGLIYGPLFLVVGIFFLANGAIKTTEREVTARVTCEKAHGVFADGRCFKEEIK